MSAFDLLQGLVLWLVLLTCSYQLIKKLMPEQLRRLRVHLSLRVNGSARWRQRLSRWLRPSPRVSVGCTQIGSSPGCNSCGLARSGPASAGPHLHH